MRVLKTLLLPLLLILSLIGVDRRAPAPQGIGVSQGAER